MIQQATPCDLIKKMASDKVKTHIVQQIIDKVNTFGSIKALKSILPNNSGKSQPLMRHILKNQEIGQTGK